MAGTITLRDEGSEVSGRRVGQLRMKPIGSDAPTEEDIRGELARILASPDFAASGQLSDFLRFVVEETLEGRAHQIKGYTVATRVFGRSESFDPSSDPVVRVQAGRLRRRLERYYLLHGTEDTTLIEVPKGGYVPAFSVRIPGRPGVLGPAPGLRRQDPEKTAAPRFDRPAILVLPVTAIGDDLECRSLAEGLTEALIAGLTEFRELAIIARHSTRAIEGMATDPLKLRSELGVDFALAAKVNKRNSTFRVAARLIDTGTGECVWADVLEGEVSASGLFGVEDRIAGEVVGQISDEYGAIPRVLGRATIGKRPSDLSAYEAVLLFYEYNANVGEHRHARAREALERAVEVDPDYALAWTLLGDLYADASVLGYEAPSPPLETAKRYARKAISLDPACQHAHWTLAYCYLLEGDEVAARREARRTIGLNPNSGFLVAASAWLLGLLGEWEESLEILERVAPLNPYGPGWLRLVPFLDHLRRAEYEEALHEARQLRVPDVAWDPLCRAAAAGHGGNATEAAASSVELAMLFPEVAADPSGYIRTLVRDGGLVRLFLEGLEKAAQLEA